MLKDETAVPDAVEQARRSSQITLRMFDAGNASAVERAVRDDRFCQFLERSWMAHQLPRAALFFTIEGLPRLIWGIAARVAVSVAGHWPVGYFAHNQGPRSWHNNHLAFPGSALSGLQAGKTDFGWWVLQSLQRTDLVWGVKTPAMLPHRTNLIRLSD